MQDKVTDRDIRGLPTKCVHVKERGRLALLSTSRFTGSAATTGRGNGRMGAVLREGRGRRKAVA